MSNDDITNLYSRISIGAKVIVLMQGVALCLGLEKGDRDANPVPEAVE